MSAMHLDTAASISVGSPDAPRRRVAFVIASMIPGGAQRVMARICNHFAAQGHDVSLFTLQPSSAGSFFPLAENVQVVPLGRPFEGRFVGRVLRVLRWIGALRTALARAKPDVVVSFIDLTNVMVLAASWRLGVPVIVSERTDPHHHAIGAVGNMLRRLLYPRASRIVVQTARAARFFAGYDQSKLVVVANPVSTAEILASPGQIGRNGRWRIIAVGRLDRPKGFELLLRAFARLAGRFRDWDVVVFGEGSEREALLAAAVEENLVDRFMIAAPVQAIEQELASSHLFAFPSRYEGFPNALAEAMSIGLPPVGFSGVSGVEDLVVSGTCGLLAEYGRSDLDAINSLAVQLAVLMSSAETRVRLGAAAATRIKEFAPSEILARWERLVADVVREV